MAFIDPNKLGNPSVTPEVRLRLAQEFEVNQEFLPSKASVYLKRIGENINNYWPIFNTSPTVIDATNFSTINQASNTISFDDTILNFTGNGYMIAQDESPSASASDFGVINYPIRAVSPDTFNLWVRYISTLGDNDIEIEILIDNNVFKTINESILNPSDTSWRWIGTTIVLPDTNEHILGIRIKDNRAAIDKILIDKNEPNEPSSTGSQYGVSPYLTIHMRVYDSVNDKPSTSLYIYDYKNSITEIVQDDWYNFNVKVLNNSSGYISASDFDGSYFLVMSCTGSSTNNFLVWELVEGVDGSSPYIDSEVSAVLFNRN